MARYLIVANQTLGGHELLETVRERARAGDCQVHVVVPATGAEQEIRPTAGGVMGSGTPSSIPAADPGVVGAAAEEARQRAHDRLKEATGRIAELGVDEVAGEVGDPDPFLAVERAMETVGPFDEIIVSTLPATISRWLRMDLASRLDRRYDVPVTHVEAERSGVSE